MKKLASADFSRHPAAPWVVVIANSSGLDANNLIRGGQGCIVDVEAGLKGLLFQNRTRKTMLRKVVIHYAKYMVYYTNAK